MNISSKTGWMNPGRRVGIMGGTFDPIHIGHLVVAEEARLLFALDTVIFVPAGRPAHKTVEIITLAEHRYLMTVLAVINNSYFQVSRFEIDNHKPSYTIDTVRYFLETMGKDTAIFFITGADAILEIISWKDYDELLGMCTFIAASRPGYFLKKIHETLAEFYPDVTEKVHLLESPAMSISSTFIRNRVREGKTIKYLTVESVEQYIRKNNLYQ